MRLQQLKLWCKQCPFYRVPDHGSCHGMCRPMQTCYVMNLPYGRDSVKLVTSLQIEIQSLKYVGKSKSKFNGRSLTTKKVRCKQQIYIYIYIYIYGAWDDVVVKALLY